MDKHHFETVNHLKKKLEKGVSFEKTMHILYKLQKIPISIKLLEDTGIGFKIRELSKAEKNNDIGKTAKLLTMNWKDFVRRQQQQQANDDSPEEEEPENHQDNSPEDSGGEGGGKSPSPERNTSSSHRHKHSKKSSSHHHQNGHHSRKTRKNSDSEGEEEQAKDSSSDQGNSQLTNSQSSKHKDKESSKHKKHKHHHKEKKEKKHHKKASKSDSEDEEANSNNETEEEAERNRKLEKRHRRREEKEARNRESSLDKSTVKRLRIKEPVDPNANSSKSNGNLSKPSSQKTLTVENGVDLFSQMLSASDRPGYTASNAHFNASKPSELTFSSTKDKSSSSTSSRNSHHPQSNHELSSSSSSSRHPSSFSNSITNVIRTPNPASFALDFLSSSVNKTENGSSSSYQNNSTPDPNYRPAIHRRLDEMMSSSETSRSARPLPRVPDSGSHLANAAAADAHKRANTAGMKLFRGQTAVWSGASKVVTVAKVYPLQELCIRLLMNHLDMIFEVGDLPYYILKPVLEKCTVGQLRRIEYYNPQLCDESDELWNEFVQKEFKTPLKAPRFDSWRDFYDHLVEARERKLKAITAGISSKARKAIPERKTQTIDVKLPREIRRRQERTADPFFSSSVKSRSSNSNYSSGGVGGTAPYSMNSSSSSGGMIALGGNKPKTAPLMKKLLQIRKGKGGFKR